LSEKKNLDPSDPAYYAPPRSREKSKAPASSESDRQALSVSRGLDEQLARFRTAKNNNGLPSAQSDAFADAVARMLREHGNGLGEAPSVLKRPSISLVAGFAAAVASAALVALAYVVFFPSPDGADDRLLSALRSWQSPKASVALPPQNRAPTLVVRNHTGLVNEPLELGVSVDAPDLGSTVTIKGMAPGARLTAGVPLSFTEWRVPAEQVASAMVIPPADFVGELNLSAELRNPDGAAQVTSFLQLVWKAATPAAPLATASTATASVVPASQPPPAVQPPPAPQPQQQQQQQQQTQQQPPPQQPQPQQQKIASLPPATTPPAASAAVSQPRADAPRELSANEIASLVRRAQEMLANGDVKAARVLLLRAAEAHDARAALALAKTFDPITLRQLSTADPGPDVAQARNWYQRAREWGAPEAQRQLDALASYSR
jgi:hypothetical protein